LIAPITLLTVSVAAFQFSAWTWLRVQPKNPKFADLRLVTATADCIRNDPNWSMATPTCDPFGRPNNYPSIWGRAFAWMRLGINDTVAVGYATLLVFSIACGVLLFQLARSKTSNVGWTVASLSVLSPPVLLAVERGNVDLIVFTLLVGAMSAGFANRSGLSAALLGLCTSLKLFPAGGTISLRRPRDFALFAFSFFTTGGFLLLSELGDISDRTQYSGYSSFGVGVLPIRIASLVGADLTVPTARFIGLGILATSIAGALLVFRTRPATHPISTLSTTVRSDARGRGMLTVGWGSFFVAYMAGTSWDYRLIVLIPCVVAFARHDRPRSAARIAMLGLFATMILSYPVGRLDIVGDLVLLAGTPVMTILVADIASGGRLLPRRSEDQTETV